MFGEDENEGRKKSIVTLVSSWNPLNWTVELWQNISTSQGIR